MRRVNSKPTAAFVITLVSGIIYLISGFLIYIILLGSMATYPYSYFLVGSFPLLFFLIIMPLSCGLALLSLACSLFIKPLHHRKFGILIVIFSLIGFPVGLLGLIPGIIGGALAITWKPIQSQQIVPLSYSRSEIICSRCGYKNPVGFEFCGRCGSTLKEEETKIY